MSSKSVQYPLHWLLSLCCCHVLKKRRDVRRNSKDSAAAPDSAYSKPQVSKKCIFRIMIILTTSTQLPLDIHNTGTDQYLQPRVKKMTPNAKSLFSIYLTTSLIGNGNRMPIFCPPVNFYCDFINPKIFPFRCILC